MRNNCVRFSKRTTTDFYCTSSIRHQHRNTSFFALSHSQIWHRQRWSPLHRHARPTQRANFILIFCPDAGTELMATTNFWWLNGAKRTNCYLCDASPIWRCQLKVPHFFCFPEKNTIKLLSVVTCVVRAITRFYFPNSFIYLFIYFSTLSLSL